MKKPLVLALALGGAIGVGVVIYGATQGWFSRAADNGKPPTQAPQVPQELPKLVGWIDERIASGDRKQESEGYAALARPEHYKRILAAAQDEKNPLPLRKQSLLLAARERSKVKELLPVLRQHAGDPKSPLRGEALVALAGLANDRLDEGGFITVAFAVATKDADPRLRLSATHGLIKLSSKAAVQALVDRLSDSDVSVRKLAAGRLKKLAGQDFGYRYSKLPKSQEAAIARWRSWAAKWQPAPKSPAKGP